MCDDIPLWLSLPVEKVLENSTIPLPEYVAQQGNRPIMDWLGWVKQLLRPCFWNKPDSPLGGLISSCFENRLEECFHGVCKPYFGCAKEQLTKYLMHGVFSHRSAKHSLDVNAKDAKNRLRTATVSQMQRGGKNLTLIRLFDLSEQLHNVSTSMAYRIGYKRHPRALQNFMSDFSSRLAEIAMFDRLQLVQEFTTLVDWLKTFSGYHPEQSRWDCTYPEGLIAQPLSNLLPPIFSSNFRKHVMSVNLKPLNLREFEDHFNSWLLSLVTEPENFCSWESILNEVLHQIRLTSESLCATLSVVFDSTKQELSRFLLLSRLSFFTEKGVLSKDDRSKFIEMQSRHFTNRLTFRNLLEVVLSLLNIFSYIRETGPFIDLCCDDNLSEKSRVAIEYLMTYIPIALTGVHRTAQLLRDLTWMVQRLRLGNWSFEQTKATVEEAMRYMTQRVQVDRASRLRQQAILSKIFELVENGSQHPAESPFLCNMSLPENQEPVYFALQLADTDRHIALCILDLDLGISRSIRRDVENRKRMPCLGIEGYRSLCLCGATNHKYARLSQDYINALARLIHNCILQQEELRQVTGEELAIIRGACDVGNSFAEWIYSGILIAQGNLVDGGRLLADAACKGDICASFLIQSEAQDWISDGYKSFAERCKTNDSLCADIARCSLVRMFEEQLQIALSSHEGYMDISFDFEHLAFFHNSETHGCIDGATVVQACFELLKPDSGLYCSSRAARRLGKMYLSGAGGLDRDAVQALRYLLFAANGESPRAFLDMASIFERGGPGVKRNGACALNFYNQFLRKVPFGAGDERDDNAYFLCKSQIANLYLTGCDNLPADYEKAKSCYRELFEELKVDLNANQRNVVLTWHCGKEKQLESLFVFACGPDKYDADSCEELLEAIGRGRVDKKTVEKFALECSTTLLQNYRSMDTWVGLWR